KIFQEPLSRVVIEHLKSGLDDKSILRPPFRYKPTLVEPLITDVASLLDRVASYRRELADLELRAVTQRLQLALDAQLAQSDSDINDASSIEESATLMSDGAAEASKAATDNAKMWRPWYEAISKANKVNIQKDKLRITGESAKIEARSYFTK